MQTAICIKVDKATKESIISDTVLITLLQTPKEGEEYRRNKPNAATQTMYGRAYVSEPPTPESVLRPVSFSVPTT